MRFPYGLDAWCLRIVLNSRPVWPHFSGVKHRPLFWRAGEDYRNEHGEWECTYLWEANLLWLELRWRARWVSRWWVGSFC